MRHQRTDITTAQATRGERTRCPLGSRGSVLVGVMGITTAVLLVGVAIFVLGHSEGDIVEYAVDDARAFYLAEGGLERARGWLGELSRKDPDANPVGQRFQDQVLGGGSYTVTIVEDKTWTPGLPAYEVVSKAEHDGVVTGVRAILVAESFSRYQWFVESGGWKWFITGERFEGPVHVNDRLQVDGDPWFGSIVRAGGKYTEKMGSNPTFLRGYETEVDEVKLPDDAYMKDVLREAAMAGGLYADDISEDDDWDDCDGYAVRLGSPAPGYLSYVGYEYDDGSLEFEGPPRVVDLSGINGVVWFEGGDVAVAGVLDGQLTIVSEKNIEIWDDVVYYDATPYGGPNPGCDDILGMIATKDIVISYTTPNRNDCIVHGTMMALEKNIEAEDYQHHPPRGDMIIHGGLLADYSIHFGQFDDGVCLSGYERDFRYDPRTLTMPPPLFPHTGHYVVYSWEEIRRS